ncbi:MAG: site-specific integrase [Gordonia paraffinivorans]
MSIHARSLKDGRPVYRARWRQPDDEGVVKQKTLTFETLDAAERFRLNVERFGIAEALSIIGVQNNTSGKVPTLLEMVDRHITAIGTVEPGTLAHYRRYRDRDLAPLAPLPVKAVTETVIATWVEGLITAGNSGKTVANKHGFLSAVLARAVREGYLVANPCSQTRLPRADISRERVFLSKAEWATFYAAMPEQWKALTQWLVVTGMRFGEATALTVADVDADDCTARVTKAWKFTGSSEARLAYPKSKAGRRVVSVPREVIGSLDLDRHVTDLLFTCPDGSRVTYPKYRVGWKIAKRKSGLQLAPHDLRHTCASWLLKSGVPMHVVQRHLGHESMAITNEIYSHVDRSTYDDAAAAMGRMLR